MIRPSDLAFNLKDIIARATNSQAVWGREPMTAEEFAKIRIEVWRYFDSLRARFEQEKEKVGV